MPKFFCDYCDVYLTHDSMSVRKAHNSGRNHLRNVVDYYQQIGHEKAQSVIDSITSSYAAEGQAGSNPMLHSNPGVGRGFPPPGGPGGFPPPGGPGGPGAPPFGMPMGPNGMPLPFPPPGGFPGMPQGMPFPPPGGFPGGMMPPNGMPFPPPGGFPGGPPPPGGFAGGFPPPGGPGAPPFPPQGFPNMPPQHGQGPPDRDPRLQGRDAYSERR